MTILSLRKAQKIVKETLSKGRALEMKPLTVVVLDAGGHMVACAREDGASPGRVKLAEGKAYGTVMLGMAGTAQSKRAEAQGYFMAAMNGLYDGKVVPVPGGVLMRDAKGVVLGAVGVTGDTSDNDALAGEAGVLSVGLVAEV